MFLLYHIKFYLQVFKISESAFWIGELLFLIWNSCNDFVFGWLFDKAMLVNDGTKIRVPVETIYGRIR